MAYNYFPATYQPLYNPQSFYTPQPQYQQPVQVQQAAQPQQTGIIWVNSGVEAQAYPVAPNNAVTLWSTAEPIVYLKQTDASGKPTMKIYDLVERKDTPAVKSEASFATKEDLSTVAGVVKGLDDVIASLKADVDSLKGDVYGIAGKKRKGKGDEVDE